MSLKSWKRSFYRKNRRFSVPQHTSITYKLKLNGGDVKAVQGDSGHSQTSMVTAVYFHLLDEDRKRNAELFEETFYQKKDTDPVAALSSSTADKLVMEVPEGGEAGLLQRVLTNLEMAALLTALAKSMNKKLKRNPVIGEGLMDGLIKHRFCGAIIY